MIVDTNQKISDLTRNKFDKINEAINECKEKTIELLPELFESAQEDNLTHIFVLGYTPTWNDGEECEHRTEVFISNKGSYPDILEYWERFDPNINWDDPDTKYKLMNQNLADNKAQKIGEKIKCEYGRLLNEALGTDWRLEIDFTKDKVQVKHDKYHCGY